MYLNKKGSEYYLAIFENAIFKSEKIIKNTSSQPSGANNIYNSELFNFDSLNMTQKLTELYQHTTNIIENIDSENNVLKQFAETIHATMKTTITDPKTAQLLKIIEQFRYFEQNFKQLKEVVNRIMVYTQKPNEKNAVEILAEYKEIRNMLDNIHKTSLNLAAKFRELINSIKAEEELIKREEVVLTDFNKNLMSWF